MTINTLPICSVSGGKDSTALYCLMVEYFGQNFLPIFADTGHEHPVTVNYVKNLHAMAGGPQVVIVRPDFSKAMRLRRHHRISALRKITVGSQEYIAKLQSARKLRPTGNSFLDMMLWKNAVPTGKLQFCTEHLKMWPIKFYLDEHYPGTPVEMYRGLRGAESKERMAKQPFSYHSFFDCPDILPLLYESEQFIFSFLESKGVPPNPLYGLGNDRVGCFPCIHANKQQLSTLPDWAWERLEWYQSTLGIPWFHDRSIAQVRDWCKTSWGGKQFDMFKSADKEDAPSCMSGWIACE